MATPGVLANIDTDEIIERIANGAIPARIAQELGVTKAAIYYQISDHPLYRKARQSGMATRLDEAEISIMDSRDQLSLSRARETFRATAWRAEREHPSVWGNQQNTIQINGNGEVKAGSSGIQITFVAAQPVQCNTPCNDISDAQVIESK